MSFSMHIISQWFMQPRKSLLFEPWSYDDKTTKQPFCFTAFFPSSFTPFVDLLNKSFPRSPWWPQTKVSFTGPAVDVGVTMYVLSISSLSEVEMVQKEQKSIMMLDDDDWCRRRPLWLYSDWLYCVMWRAWKVPSPLLSLRGHVQMTSAKFLGFFTPFVRIHSIEITQPPFLLS